ncbi:MAG: DUF4403 family protein [Chitinophagales bacterium]
MAIFERVLGGTIFYDFWTQVQQYLFAEKRFVQLITLKPIEIYKTETELEIDEAKIKLFIQSKVENLVQRRLERTFNLLTLNLSKNEKTASVYNFDVVINAQMQYEEVSKFFNFHFGNQRYEIEKDYYYLDIENFKFGNKNTKAIVELPFVLDAKWLFIKRKMTGKAIFSGSVNFHQPKFNVKTRNLDYVLETKSTILKIIDWFYHGQLIDFLQNFLQYNFKDDLELAKVEAQKQIDSFQNQTNWINGVLNDVDLERITIENDGVHAVFLAEGKLHFLR